MRLLWLCNIAPSIIYEKITRQSGSGGLWMDHVLSDLRKFGQTIHILCPGSGVDSGDVDAKCSYATFSERLPHQYLPELEEQFRKEIIGYAPDVIHIWGTEYGHTLAMVNACMSLGYIERVAVSIQGLCSVIARHYVEGVPACVQRSYTFRDLVRWDNVLQQQHKFSLRGELEIMALKKVCHVIGRTDWDEACTKRINPDVQYHFCNETLRETFYQGQWNYNGCKKYRIFASGCVYPVKGFHYLLEAFTEVLKTYPDATLAVPGGNPLIHNGINSKLRESSYSKYLAKLIRKYHLEDKVEFLGHLSAEQMKQAYLDANVFVLPSTIENSPNSLGEAMLLGTPCVAADVGGVTSMLEHKKEGFVYQSTAPYMLAYYIKQIFSMGDCAQVSSAARAHALKTHNAQGNIQQLIKIYRDIESVTT